MNKYIFLLLFLAGMAACTDHKDLYDPNLSEKEYEKNWKEQFGDIDPNQTWNMAVSRHATINLLEDALSEYNIQLYTADPLYDSSALLLASHSLITDASGAGSASFDFDMPKNVKTVYTVRVDNHGRRLVHLADIGTDGNVRVSFGKVTKRSLRSVVTEYNLPIVEAPYTEEEVNSLIDSAYDLKDGLSWSIVHNEWWTQTETITDITNIYKVAKGYVVKATSEMKPVLSLYAGGYRDENNNWIESLPIGKIKLIIAAGGVYTPSSQIAGIDLIVADGGILDLTNQNIQMLAKSRIIVMPGGKIVDNSKDKNESNYSINHEGIIIYNAGTIEAKVINVVSSNSAALYNAPTGIIKSNMLVFSNSNTILTNYGKIETEKILGNPNDDWGQVTINNGCLLKANLLNAAYLNQAANTAVECETIRLNGGLTLRENSIIRSEHLTMNNLAIQYVGVAEGKALISTKMVDYANEITIVGNIYFEADSFADGNDKDSEQSQYYSYYKLIHEAIEAGNALGLTKVGEATLSIPEGDCTGGGNNPVEEVKPTPVKTPTWIIACEDLGDTDDFDFNDIVIGITYDNSARRLTVTPLAAGGTLRSVVCYNNMEVGEIHEMLGGSSSSMINTHSKGTPGDSKVIENVSSFDIKANMGGLSVKISKISGENDSQIYAPGKGDIPQMICVPGTWAWPTERTSIEKAYTDFPQWSGDASNTAWIDSAVESEVVK